MFDELFGVTASDLNEANRAQAIEFATVLIALLEKGVVTVGDLEAARSKATLTVDRLFASKRDQAEAEFDGEHPGMRDLFKKLTGFEYDKKPMR